jgi:hypothetical protein
MNGDDYGFGGFFALRTPDDLLHKLRHDRQRLAANPSDSYAAFDFFVTANSLVDWISSSSSPSHQPRANHREDVLPRLCRHLADGAKHLQLTRPHHGVSETQHVPAARYGEAVYGVSRYDMPASLLVHLEPTEAEALGRPSIDAQELADLVLAYWTQRLEGPTEDV